MLLLSKGRRLLSKGRLFLCWGGTHIGVVGQLGQLGQFSKGSPECLKYFYILYYIYIIYKYRHYFVSVQTYFVTVPTVPLSQIFFAGTKSFL